MERNEDYRDREEASPGEITVRLMREEDLPEVAEIEKRNFTQPWSEDGFRRSLRQKDTIYVTACRGGAVVGYAGLLRSFEEADITNVCVDEKYRRCGAGSELISRLMEEGKRSGIARFTLEVRKSNTAALRLYEKYGFHTVGIRKNFYSFPREDAFIMWTGEDGTKE